MSWVQSPGPSWCPPTSFPLTFTHASWYMCTFACVCTYAHTQMSKWNIGIYSLIFEHFLSNCLDWLFTLKSFLKFAFFDIYRGFFFFFNFAMLDCTVFSWMMALEWMHACLVLLKGCHGCGFWDDVFSLWSVDYRRFIVRASGEKSQPASIFL